MSDTKWGSRIDAVHAYFEFEFSSALRRLSLEDARYAAAKERSDVTLAALKEDRPSNSSQPRYGLRPDLVDRLLAITEPDHPENPWLRANQVRNRMIVVLMCLLGLRLGELLSLLLSDVRTRGGNPHLDVRRRPPDLKDTRVLPPVPKTRGRRLPLSPTAASATDKYILHHRMSTGSARQSKYLVLSREGRPLSPRSVQSMFELLRTRHPIFGALCGHMLRNTNSDFVQEALAKSGLNDKQCRDVHTYIGGWVPDSEQPARYSQRWLTGKAERISLDVQHEILGDLE